MMAAEKFSLQEAQELKSKILRLPESEYMPKDPSVIQAVKAKLDSMIQTTKSDFQNYGELKQFCQVDSRKVDAGKYEIKPESDKRTNAEIMAEYLSYNLTKYAHAKTPRQKDMNKSNVKILNYSSDLDENLKLVLVIRDKANSISTAEAVPDPVQPSEAVQAVTALSSLADTRQIKTEQEKDAEQDVGRRAVEAHQTRSIKSVKESAKESHSVESGTDTDIPVSVISPDCFWDYQTACNIVTAEPEPYLIEGMFRKGTITIIGATQNAGKTTVLFDVMGSVATGSNFLVKPDKTGGFKAHQGSCILLDFEGDKVDTASRLRATVDTYSEISGIEPNDIPILVRYMPIDWTGSDKEFPTKVYKAISALPEPYNKPAVLAFDTYSAFSDVENENESTQAQKVFNRFKELKTLFHDETTIFVTMHLRKLNDKKFHDVTMDDLRGTSAAAAAGSDIWFLSEVKGEPTTKKLKQVKAKGRSRSDEIKTLSLTYDSNDDGTYSRVRFFMIEGTDEAEAQAKQTERKQKNEDKRERDILAFIATHPKCSVNRICKVNKDNPEDRLQMNVKTCTPVVDRLIKEGKIYNLSDSENSYCLVINPKYTEEKHN